MRSEQPRKVRGPDLACPGLRLVPVTGLLKADAEATEESNEMAVVITAGWILDVDEGPEWLFLRLRREGEASTSEPPLAECAWRIADEHRKNRLVFELGEGTALNSFIVGQLILLHKRAQLAGGVFRICCFRDSDHALLRTLRIADRFPNYAGREQAVLGQLPA
jgi:anti-anti-sigma regulatory factor